MTDILKPIVVSLEIDYSPDLAGDLLQKIHQFYHYAPIASVGLSYSGKATADPKWYEKLAELLNDSRLPLSIRSDFAREFTDEELLALNKLKQVQINLESSSRAAMEKRSVDVSMVIANVIRLRQAMLETRTKTELLVNCMVTRANITHLGGVARLALLLGVDVLSLSEARENPGTADLPDTLEELNDAEARSLADSVIDAVMTLNGTATKFVALPGLRQKVQPVISAISDGSTVTAAGFRRSARGANAGPCLQPWTTVIVKDDGAVKLCFGPFEPVGNLVDDSLINIVNGMAARELRATALKGGSGLPCQSCAFATADSPDAFSVKVGQAHARYDAAVLPWQAHTPTGLTYDAEHGITTQAKLLWEDLDADAVGTEALKTANHYGPTLLSDLDLLFDAVPLAPETSTMIDLGAGMGRVLFYAAQRPYRQVIGVEISPALADIAKANVDTYRGPLACRDIQVVCADATLYEYPPGDLVIYLFNPFTGPVFTAVLDKLSAHDGEVVIVYNEATESALIDAHPGFVRVADVALTDRRNYARVWRARR